MIRAILAFLPCLLAAPPGRAAEELISIRGAQAAAEAVTAATLAIKKNTGLEFRVITDGGSGGAISSIGEDVVDVALLSRKITAREQASWPNRTFHEARFGMQALLIVVPEQVWQSGVRALTRDQLREIYESHAKNWKTLGGEDRKIVFFNRDVRGSAWELLMVFLYEDTRKAQPSTAEVLVEPSDVTTAVEFTGGAISFLEYGAPRPAQIHALGIRQEDGSVVEPNAETIASGRYPLARPLIIATPRKPAGKVRRFVDFMLGAEGQAFVKKAGHLTNEDLAEKK